MDTQKEALDALKKLREQGLTLELALNELKGKKYGLIPVVKAIRAVEGLSYSEAIEILERRGDYEQF